MTTCNTFSVMLRDEISALLEPLLAAVQQPDGVQMLLQSLGRSDALSSRTDLRTEIERLATLGQGLSSLEDDTLGSWAGLTQVLNLARDLFTALQRLEHLVSDPALAEQCRDLGRDLVQYLLALYLRSHHPTLFRTANLLTLITPLELAPPLPSVFTSLEGVSFPRYIDQFHPGRITDLLKQPLPTLTAHYFPNGLVTAADAHEASHRLFPALSWLAQTLDLSSFSDLMRATPEPVSAPPPEDIDLDHFSGSTPDEGANPVILPPPEPVDLTPYFETFLPHFGFVLPGQQAQDGSATPARFAVSTLLSSSRHPGGARGLVITPLGQLDWSEMRDGWRLGLQSSGQVPAFVLGPGGMSKAPVDSPLTAATARLVLERVAEAGAPAFSVGAANGTRLEIGALRCTTDIRVAPSDSAIELAADALSGVFVLAPGDGDGFLQAILPDDGLRCTFDLGVALSSTHGLRLRGAAGLEGMVPVGLSVGGVTIPALYLGLRTSAQGLSAEVSANATVSIGPVVAVIERMGLTAAVTFPDTGGNLGIADLTLDFKPPSGVGLSIDAAGVTGGGFLSFDPDRGQYAGVVQLQTSGIAVKGLGLIATRLPNNAKGFSLLVIISAEGFKPIPLGMGFSLTGVGGLLALNRTFNEDVLRAGLKNHTLDSVLFPPDPIRNAPQILSTLQNVFPVASGHHLFGPVARITWGTPPLLTADLGLVLEFGKRLRLLILGQITAILPRRENDLIRLQMDTIGVVDVNQGTAALDATLYDSRLLKKFVLTGDMAMRLRWEGAPSFALAVGGMHPAYNPPPNFPKLERIALNLAAGDNPRLRCEAYFALTANTVQFGSRTELYAAVAGFSIQGETGHDVLIQLDPFQFLAEFYAQVQLKRGSHNLFKVRVEGALAGPRPLHIKAKATFEVLWMDVTLRIDKTLVAGEKPPRPAPIDVLPLLKEALGQPDNWVARLPDGQHALVTLRPRQGAANEVPLHPLGSLTVKQNVVPLNLDITRFGQTTPAGARRFTISSVSLGGQSQAAPPPVRDFFAPAQFFEMSDDEKLSRPSFESLPAGVSFGADAFTFSDHVDDWLEVDAIAFDTITVDPETRVSRSSGPTEAYALSPELLGKQARFGAAGASVLRRLGNAKYRTARVGHRVVKEGWSLVDTTNLSVPSVPGMEAGQPVAYSEAAEALRHLQQTNPAQARGLQILRLSELQGATLSHT